MVKQNNNQPHIAFYLHGLYGGGAERVIINLANSFAEQEIKTDIVINSRTGAYLPDVSEKVTIVNLNALRGRDGYGLPQLIKYLIAQKPDALLSTTHYSNERAILAKLLTGVKTKIVVREANHLSVQAHQMDDPKRKWTPITTKITYPWANGIIAVSESLSRDLQKVTGLSPSRINVVYNPSITPKVISMGKEYPEHEWFRESEPPVILAVGRLQKQKDYPTLIKAFAIIRKFISARLMILGETRNAVDSGIYKAIEENDFKDDIALPGFQKNPYSYIAHSAVVVSSSRFEGLSNVLVEAMALNTPVIATDCPGGSAEILNYGKYGDLVPVGDSQVMAQAIVKVLSGNTNSVDSAWLNKFKLETGTKQYLDILLSK